MRPFDSARPTLADRPRIGRTIRHRVVSAAGFALVVLARGYQLGLRPLLIGSCKYCPTCSEYFIEAVQKHGPWRGGLLGLRRLARCHPFGPGGIDPVP